VGGTAMAAFSLNQLLRAQPAPAAEEAADEEIIEPS
jgi:hypothetical protein